MKSIQKALMVLILWVFVVIILYYGNMDFVQRSSFLGRYNKHMAVGKTNHTVVDGHLTVDDSKLTTNDTLHPCGSDCSIHTSRKNQTIEVHVDGDLKCVLCAYTAELNSYRLSIVNSNTSITNNEPQHTVIGNGNCRECNYFELIGKFNYAFTIKLSWKSLVESNWTRADYPLKHHYEDMFPPTQVCTANNDAAECLYHINSQTNLVKSNKLPLPRLPKADQGFPEVVFFSHVVLNGQIDERGNVRSGKLDLVVNQCAVKRFIYKPTKVFVDEVLIANQFWGDTYFHAHVESMVRIAPYLQFLRDNPSVHIYVGTKTLKDNLGIFGISEDRLVTGNVKARIIYVPQGSGCGTDQPLQTQILHDFYQKYILDNLKPGPWNSVVQICRSNRRFLIQEKQVVSMLQRLSKVYNFTYEQFRDNPIPSFEETLKMFSRARIVVAPHGAGLANMLYSRTETRLVEVLQSKRPNGVFRELARFLTQPYVGLVSIKPNEETYLGVDVPYLERIVERMMKAIRTQ